ncbi:putative virion structural protein [Serratia phage vB_SmaM_Haymo]|nr:putative virion structural protein [Serratia phage vB_SmaM_Haymo]
MSLFDEDEKASSINPPQVLPNETPFKGISIDTQYTPVSTMLTAIEGRSWIVDYFSQVLNGDDETSSHQMTRLGIHQQYNLIQNLELMVTDPLPANPTYDTTNNEFTGRGVANMYPGVRPNVGDMFTASLLDGKLGLFQVTENIQQRTIYRQTAFTIEYVLKSILSRREFEVMMSKVQRTYHFHKSFLDSGINPILTDEAHNAVEEFESIRKRLPRQYMTQYFNKEYGTLLVPDQGQRPVYDPFLTKFVTNLWSRLEVGTFNGMNNLNVMDGIIREFRTIYDALLHNDPYLIDVVEAKIPIVDTSTFFRNPYYGPAWYVGIPFVFYPKSNPDDYMYSMSEAVPKAKVLQPGKIPERNGPPRDPDAKPSIENGIKLVNADEYYVFSADFYSKSESQSALETLVWQTLDNGSIDAKTLIGLFKDSRDWSNLERFYYLPIMFAIIPAALRGLPS